MADQGVVWAAYTATVGIPEHAEPADWMAGCARCGHADGGDGVGRAGDIPAVHRVRLLDEPGCRLCAMCVWRHRHRRCALGYKLSSTLVAGGFGAAAYDVVFRSRHRS